MKKVNEVRVSTLLPLDGWRNGKQGRAHINRLFGQLSPYQNSEADLQKLASQNHLFIAVDHGNGYAVVGIVRLASHFDPVSHQHQGVLHDEVVDLEYRGRGIGKALAQAAIEVAKKFRYTHVDAFPKQKRVVASNLYSALGFTLVSPAEPDDPESTNFYRLTL